MNEKLRNIKFYFDLIRITYIFQLRHEWAWDPDLFKHDLIGKLFLRLNKVDYKKWDKEIWK